MRKQTLYIFFIYLSFISIHHSYSKQTCPRQCECDVYTGQKRVTCVMHNIIDVNLKVPNNIQIYDLSYNIIQKIEDFSFKEGYQLLHELNLSYNMIFWIGLFAFDGLINLKTLDLKHNRLQILPPDSLINNVQLEWLDLSGNKFLNFPNKPFLIHKNLKVLSLKNSQISYLPQLVFEGLPNLVYLDLSDNLMIELKIDTFKTLLKLKEININSNQWTCSKSFGSFLKWLQSSNIDFDKQCETIDMDTKKFEKMVRIDNDIEATDKELDDSWEIENISNETIKTHHEINTEDFLEKFNKNVPPLFSFFFGLVIGFVVGMFITFCAMSYSFRCPQIKLRNRSHIRRLRRAEMNEATDQLLQNYPINGVITPPVIRRQLSNLSDSYRSNSFIMRNYDISIVSSDEIRVQSNGDADVPPPPYKDIFHDIVLNT